MAQRATFALKDELGRVGFTVTCKAAGEVDRYVGLRPVQRPAGWEPMPYKLGLLDGVLEHIASLSELSVVTLRVAHSSVSIAKTEVCWWFRALV